MKKHSKSGQRSEPSVKRAKARGPVQRDVKEVLAEVLGKLTGKLAEPAVSTSAEENHRGNTVAPNRNRLAGGSGSGGPLESVLHSWFGGISKPNPNRGPKESYKRRTLILLASQQNLERPRFVARSHRIAGSVARLSSRWSGWGTSSCPMAGFRPLCLGRDVRLHRNCSFQQDET